MGQATIARPTPSVPARAAGGQVAEVAGAARRVCLWAAVATAVTYLAFILGAAAGSAGVLAVPWDQVIPIGASTVIAPSFVLLMVGLHHCALGSERVWTHAAIAFAILYAAFVSLVYVTLLFVVEPHAVNHTQSQVSAFLFDRGTFTQMVDGLGYAYMSLAVAMTFPLFSGPGLGRWIRWTALLSFPSALGVLAAYALYSFPWSLLGVGSLLVPIYAVLLSIYFMRAERRRV